MAEPVSLFAGVPPFLYKSPHWRDTICLQKFAQFTAHIFLLPRENTVTPIQIYPKMPLIRLNRM